MYLRCFRNSEANSLELLENIEIMFSGYGKIDEPMALWTLTQTYPI